MNLYKLNNLIKDENIKEIYAHKKIDKKNKIIYETLEEHSNLTINYFKKLKGFYKLNDVCKNLKEIYFSFLTNIDCDFIQEIFYNCIYLHDCGKVNPLFQEKIKLSLSKKDRNSNHSQLSALIIYNIYVNDNRLINSPNKLFLKYILYNFCYIVSCHHTQLDQSISQTKINSINNYNKKEYNQFLKFNIINIPNISLININLKDSEQQLSLYVLYKYLYSYINICDDYATNEFMNCDEINFNEINIENLFHKYINDDLYKKINDKNFNADILQYKNMNDLRDNIFLESQKTLKENLDKNIFYLESPTGSGKTNVSLNLAYILMNKFNMQNLFYVFPFNTLIYQTKNILSNYFDKNMTIIRNSLTPITSEDISSLSENIIEQIYDDYKYLKSPITLTSHIQLFNILFGNNRYNTLLLYKLQNSVIILDEIQNYKNDIWKPIIDMLIVFSNILNIKVIIMSATLPALNILTNFESKYINLLNNNYGNHPVFKDRVTINFDFLTLNKEQIFEEILKKITEYKDKKILVEFITKKTAKKFYEYINDIDSNIYFITGETDISEKENILNEIKNIKNCILICTQILEAGVDIDMDIGFKNISLLESEEQFAGRFNRNFLKKNSSIFLFMYDKPANIYNNDNRTIFSLNNKNKYNFSKNCLINKTFKDYYLEVFSEYDEYELKNFYNLFKFYKYDNIKDFLKLIKNEDITIILNKEIIIDNKLVKGEDLLEKYDSLVYEYKNNKIKYKEFKIKQSQLESLLSKYTKNVSVYEQVNFSKIREYKNCGLFLYDDKIDFI